jgi:hypothetical protein
MPAADTAPPAIMRAAVTMSALSRPALSRCCPAIKPANATVISPAIRATALLTADPIPACSTLIEPRMADVSGATVSASPSPNRMADGSSCVQ